MRRVRIETLGQFRELVKQLSQKGAGNYQDVLVELAPTAADKILDAYWLGADEEDGTAIVGPTQRQIKQNTVSRYARQIRAGTFSHGTNTIGIVHPSELEQGAAIGDGFHRLLAQVQAGVDQLWVFRFNLTLRDIVNIDTGMTRSVADAARVAGLQHKHVAQRDSIARMVHRHRQGQWPVGTHQLGNEEALALIENTEHLDRAVEVVNAMPAGLRFRSFGFCYVYFCEAGHATDADLFFDALAQEDFDRRTAEGACAVRLLHDRLDSDYRRRGTAKYTGQRAATDMVYLTVMAFNKFLKGERAKKLQLPPGWPLSGRHLKLPAVVDV